MTSAMLIPRSVLVFMMAWWAGVLIAAGQGKIDGFETFELRRDALLRTYAETGTEKFIKAQCLFAIGRNAEALAELNKGLDALEPGNKINRWMHGGNTGFIAWPGIECYVRFEKYLDDATRDRFKRIYIGGVFYAKLSTSNHKIMAALTRYLATQVWGAEAFRADPYFMEKDPYIIEMTGKAKNPPPGYVWGTIFTKGDESGESYLRDIIKATVRGGPGEFASRPYGAQNVLPLLSLADCAKDPEMAAQARIAYEVCLAQIAPAWLGGHIATFAPRSYPDTESQQPWGFATLPWLYFGGVSPKLSGAKAAAAAAISTYVPPALIVNAANDRSSAYFYQAFINGWVLNHYVNRTYAMFSRSAKAGGKPWQGQSYPCGVMWEEADPEKGSHLWITNPAADEKDKMGIHTHGVRPYEQEILGRDSLLFVFQIPDDAPFPYALGYVPGGHRAVINEAASEGRIFLHYGSVLISVTSSQSFQWDEKDGIRAPASKPRVGDSEFRVHSRNCAIAIETAPPSEFPGTDPMGQLTAFRQAIKKRSALNSNKSTPVSASYRNRFGNLLECVFDGADRIDGKALDYKHWPSLKSPWTSQTGPEGPLVIRNKHSRRTYDFNQWKITETTDQD